MLKRDLGLVDVFAIASGAMISSGLFILPGIAFARAGPAAILSYLIAGILVLPTVLSKAELVTAMPKAGGDYFYITRSIGPLAGTIAGLASWFSLSLKSAFALVGMGIFAILINPHCSNFTMRLIAAVFCLIFMALNLLGIKEAGKTQTIIVIGLFAILIIYVGRGFLNLNPANLNPFMPFGWSTILSTAGLVFISFGGLTKVASIAEEIKNPKFNVPMGMFLAYFVVLILYAAVVFITIGVLESGFLQKSLTPISDGARVFWGTTGIVITAIGALLAFISTANAGIMSASRYPMAMSRDHMLPKTIAKINQRFKTPHITIVLTAAFMIAIIMFLDLEILVEAASTMILLLYISSNLSVIMMRESRLLNYQPSFRAPFYPYLQIIGIIGYIFLIYDMGRDTLIITGLFVIIAIIWYIIYVRKRISYDSALMYVVERVTDRQIVTDTLREELREIIKEREQIIEDEFDHLIKNAIIIDLEDVVTFDDFINIAAENLHTRHHHLNKNRLKQLFIEREKQSCTALRPGLAIPHIIIPGDKIFDIMLIRSRNGINFPDAEEPVHIVFALVGSRDMRNLHLRALMAIAQISQQTNFDRKWIKAKTIEDLRDIVLLGKRKRQ